VLRGAAAESRMPDIDVVVKAHAKVYSVLVDYTGTGRQETPELITKWLEKMDKMSTRKSAISHQTAVALGHRTESGAVSGSRVVPEQRGEVEKKTKIVAKPQGIAKRAEDGAGKEDKRIAAKEQATKKKHEQERIEAKRSEEREQQEAGQIEMDEYAKKKEKEARMIRSKPQGGGEEDAEEEDVEMSEPLARPESSKRKKRVDSSELDNTEVEGEEEEDVEMEDDEIDADADADAQSGGPNRPLPEMTTEINNPPCIRCKRLKITCFVKKAQVGDTKKRPACFPCAGKKQRCDWEDESEPAPGPVKTKPTQKPTQKPTPTLSRPI